MQRRFALGVALTMLAGTLWVRVPRPAADPVREGSLRQVRAQGNALYRAFRFHEAEQVYQEGYRRAVESRSRAQELRFLINLGSVRFATFRYREAMQAFLNARRLAGALGDREMQAVAEANLSSLYLQQQDADAGAEAAEGLLVDLERRGPAQPDPFVTMQSAILLARRGEANRAEELLRRAVRAADVRGDSGAMARALDQLGYESLRRGDPASAEAALVSAYRIRKLGRMADLQYSYYTLGLLRLAQGDGRAAVRLLDQCLESHAKAPGVLTLWRVFYDRGRAKLTAGDERGALADFLEAVRSARRIRAAVVPADSIWVNTGVDQAELYLALIRAAAALYFRSGEAGLARTAFEAAEEIRASGLRALLQNPAEWQRRLPPLYWETLARLRAAESLASSGDPRAAERERRKLRYQLTEMEANAGLALPGLPYGTEAASSTALEDLRRAMTDDESYVSVQLDEPQSYLWVVTRRNFQMFPLSGRARIETQASRFVAALRRGAPEHISAGAELYRLLFGGVPEALMANRRWSLSLDGSLLLCPMGALVVDASGRGPQYLTQRHTLRLVPAARLSSVKRGTDWSGPFVGVADPIYNTADPRRLPFGPTETAGAFPMLGILPRAQDIFPPSTSGELVRLAASGREVRACFDAWGTGARNRVVLSGEAATFDGVRKALESRPAVAHFATHFVSSSSDKHQAMIALSLDDRGAPQLLGPEDVMRLRLNPRLAVLSGCSSAAAETLPAEGLMGMTRAWLATGAGSVLATLWPTPDDQGDLLAAFYRRLAESHAEPRWAVAEALRHTQCRALEAGGAGGLPASWAAYVLTGME